MSKREIKTIIKEKNIKIKIKKLQLTLERIEVEKLIDLIPKRDEFLTDLRKDLQRWYLK